MMNTNTDRDNSDDESVIDTTATYYDEHFQEYIRTWSKYFHYGIFTDETKSLEEAQENSLRKIAELTGVAEEKTILDLGCGLGSSSIYIAREYGSTLIGIDPSEEQIDFAIMEARKAGVDKALFSKGDAYTIPLDFDSVDIVLCNEVFCHVADKKRALEESNRVLKEGGYLAITDLFDETNGAHTTTFHQDLKHYQPMVSRQQYMALIAESPYELIFFQDYTAEIKKNYEIAFQNIEKDKSIALDEVSETKKFYHEAIQHVENREIGWFLCILRNHAK